MEQRSDFDSVAAQADPEKNLIPELGILGIEIDPRIAAAATGLREAIKGSTRGAAMTLQIQREERLMYVTFLFE